MTVEGENDDISGVGQTEAAHRLCVNIPADRRIHYLQPAVGHYGVFNGSRFRAESRAAHLGLHPDHTTAAPCAGFFARVLAAKVLSEAALVCLTRPDLNHFAYETNFETVQLWRLDH